MRFRCILIALLSAMLTWSIRVNRQADELLEEARDVISEQSKTIEEYESEINRLSEIVEEQDERLNKDIELLAKLINAEAGSQWCDPEMRRMVGVVALNRTKNEGFPDTLDGVIHDQGQYACVVDGNINKEPSSECYSIAEDLLENGYTEPENVVYQAEFPQGSETYKKVQNMYFCI